MTCKLLANTGFVTCLILGVAFLVRLSPCNELGFQGEETHRIHFFCSPEVAEWVMMAGTWALEQVDMGSNPGSPVCCCTASDKSLGLYGPLVSHLENGIIITAFLETVVARSCCCFRSGLLLA